MLAAKLRRRSCTQERIAEVTQETFRRVLTAVRESAIQDSEALGAFVNSTSEHVLADLHRKDSRRLGLALAGDSLFSREPAQDDVLLREEDRAHVHRILDGLPEKDRTILRLFYFDEEDKDEICSRLGVDREYLRVLLFRARVSFQKHWNKKRETKH